MWTTEEIRQLNLALASQNAAEITRLMNIYQQEIPSKEKFLHLKKMPHYLLAFQIADTHNVELSEKLINFYFKNSSEIKRVLPYIRRPQTTAGLNSADLDILYHLYSGLEYLAFFDHLKLFDHIFKQYPFDLSFVIPTEYSLTFMMRSVSKGDLKKFPLIFRLAVNDKEDWVKTLLSPKYKINLETELDWDDLQGVTLLYVLCKQPNTSLSLLQLMIDLGADPYHPIKYKNRVQEVNTYMLLQLFPNTKPQFEKLKECLANKKPVIEEVDSAEHSDGSPANSVGSSPKNSPPGSSLLSPDSPPRMSLDSSRRASPTGSPMQLSDSDSSGSSPPRGAGQAANPAVQRGVMSGTSNTSGSVSGALDHKTGQNTSDMPKNNAAPKQIIIPPGDSLLCKEFIQASLRDMYELQKQIYDTGRIKLDCICKVCSKKNMLQSMLPINPDLTKYMLYHPKYPADINSVNNDGRTALHLKAAGDGKLRSSIPNRNSILTFTEVYADRQPNLNARDKDGNTPLHLAAASGGENSHEAVEELLKAGADKTITNKAGLTPEQYCIANCKEPDIKDKVLQEFKKVYKKPSLSSNVQQPASQSAIIYNKPLPLPSRPIDVKPTTPSSTGLTGGYGLFSNSTQRPVDQKPKWTQQDISDLIQAAVNSDTNALNALLEKGVPIDSTVENQKTALHEVARTGNLPMVKYIVGRGANLAAKTSDGYTAFNLAEQNNKYEVTQYIFEQVLERVKYKEIPQNELTIQHNKELGRGASGIVCEGQYQNMRVAVKRLEYRSDPEVQKQFILEANYLTAFNSPAINSPQYVINCFGVVNNSALVLKHMSGGSLDKLLFESKIDISKEKRAQILLKIAKCLAFLDTCGVTYGDVKEANVLITFNEQTNEYDVQLSDFGTAKIRRKLPLDNQTMTQVGAVSCSGTLAYMAPELFERGASTTYKSDIYSFGVLANNLLSGQKPYQDMKVYDIQKKVAEKGLRPKIPSDTPKGLKTLLESCWSQDPKARPSMYEVVARLEQELAPVPLSTSDKSATKISQFSGLLKSTTSIFAKVGSQKGQQQDAVVTPKQTAQSPRPGLAGK